VTRTTMFLRGAFQAPRPEKSAISSGPHPRAGALCSPRAAGAVFLSGILLTMTVRVAAAEGDALQYEGVYVCKKCHSMTKRDYYDNVYELWEKSPHANGMKELSSQQSKDIGAKMGIADVTTDVKCVKCHATAGDADTSQQGKFYAREEGVTCEGCHGPGSKFKKKEIHAENYDEATKVGFSPIKKKEEVEKLCTRCHNPESPTYHADFMSRWYKWQHPTIQGKDGKEGPAKKNHGDWAPLPPGATRGSG